MTSNATHQITITGSSNESNFILDSASAYINDGTSPLSEQTEISTNGSALPKETMLQALRELGLSGLNPDNLSYVNGSLERIYYQYIDWELLFHYLE